MAKLIACVAVGKGEANTNKNTYKIFFLLLALTGFIIS
jgi:hypothetical protein